MKIDIDQMQDSAARAEELLKAMQGKAPAGYKDKLERYYKAIGQ